MNTLLLSFAEVGNKTRAIALNCEVPFIMHANSRNVLKS